MVKHFAAPITVTLTLLAALSFPFDVSAQDVLLSEFVARNDSTLLDEDGEYPDWAEIHNPTLTCNTE